LLSFVFIGAKSRSNPRREEVIGMAKKKAKKKKATKKKATKKRKKAKKKAAKKK